MTLGNQGVAGAKHVDIVFGGFVVEPNQLALVLGFMVPTFLSERILETNEPSVYTENEDRLQANQTLWKHIRSSGCRHRLTSLVDSGAFEVQTRETEFFPLFNISCNIAIELEPNYRRSIEGIYTDATRYMMGRPDISSSFLYQAGIGQTRKSDSLPSWVPDWSTRLTRDSFGLRADDDEDLDLPHSLV